MNLLELLCSKLKAVQIPAAHPSYYVSDGSTASIYSVFQGKLWELALTADMLREEQEYSGAMQWGGDKFVNGLIASVKQGGMAFDDAPSFSFTTLTTEKWTLKVRNTPLRRKARCRRNSSSCLDSYIPNPSPRPNPHPNPRPNPPT